MKWTREKPTVPGFYWYRVPDVTRVVWVYDYLQRELWVSVPGHECDMLLSDYDDDDADWAGPLEPPTATDQEDRS